MSWYVLARCGEHRGVGRWPHGLPCHHTQCFKYKALELPEVKRMEKLNTRLMRLVVLGKGTDTQ